jgi:hypothetical protein
LYNLFCLLNKLKLITGRNPLLPRANERPNNSNAAPNRPEVSDQENIFDPNVGFGPMGAQYNGPNMVNPFFLPQQPPPGSSPFLNQPNNSFWGSNPNTHMGMPQGPSPNKNQNNRPPPGRSGPPRRGNSRGVGNNNVPRGWNR